MRHAHCTLILNNFYKHATKDSVSTDSSTTKPIQANSEHVWNLSREWIFIWITCSSCLLLVEHLDALGNGEGTQLCPPSGRQLLQVKTFFQHFFFKNVIISVYVCLLYLSHVLHVQEVLTICSDYTKRKLTCFLLRHTKYQKP